VIKFPIVLIAILLISVLIVAGGTITNPTEEAPESNSYTFPLSVADNIYVVSVRSNYTSTPEVSYFELLKSVSIDFKGNPANAFCNITIPADLIWGEFSVIDKYYEMDTANYTESSNSTHNSFYFTFDHIAYSKHFEIKATEGASASAVKFYTYPLSDGEKTFNITLETDLNVDSTPTVNLFKDSETNQYGIELYFHSCSEKQTLTYNITFPTALVGGDISLIRKYYLQDPDSYTLSNNVTHNSLHMTFDYNPVFSGNGYFVIKGTDDLSPAGEFYTFPLSVENQTYIVTIESNYSSAPEVSYFGLLKSVYFEFRGAPETSFCNITIPNNLIWGELSLYAKGYKMGEDYYIQSSNSTHNSFYFTFDHIAAVKTFDVKGTEGVQTVP